MVFVFCQWGGVICFEKKIPFLAGEFDFACCSEVSRQ